MPLETIWFMLFCFNWKTKSFLGRFCSTQSITHTSEIPSIIYKGMLTTAERERFVKFPKVPRGNMCDATQGSIQLVVEVKSLDNLGSPGGDVCYWLRCSEPPLKNPLAVLDPHLTLIQRLKARNTPWGTTLFLSFTSFTPSEPHRATPNLPWRKSHQRKTPLCILTARICLIGYKEAFFSFLLG